MSQRSDVSPATLGVEVGNDGVAVEYLDGRRAEYRGVPGRVEGTVRCQPGKEVHVLVTGPDAKEGAMLYVNDRRTDDGILEESGVGRIVLEPGDSAEPLPGVTVHMDGYATEVRADPETASGRVFVFEEDGMGERAYEIVADG